MKLWAVALLAALLYPPAAFSQTEVIETGGTNVHIWKVAGSATLTLKIADFDFDVDGDIDANKVVKVGIKNGTPAGTAAGDTLCIHALSAYHCFWYPENSSDAIPVELRRLTQIDPNHYRNSAASNAPDSVVIRYVNSSTDSVAVYVWVE